jgi:SAM-dependent methyltransferase
VELLSVLDGEEGKPGPDPASAAWAERRLGLAAAYDGIGERYNSAFPNREAQLRCGGWLLEQLRPPARVLDLGSGTGLPTARQLVDGGLAVTGVDISPRMCDLAAANVPGARFLNTDVMSLDPADGSYDAAVAFFSFLNLPRHGIASALRLVHTLLRPGGLFCIAMVESDIDDVVIPFLGRHLRVSGYLRDELRAEVESAGFSVEEEKAISYAPASTQAQPEVQLFLNCRRAG